MKIINKSRKIIGINGEPLLPGADLELPEGMETHPVISYYLQKGIVVDSQNVSAEEKQVLVTLKELTLRRKLLPSTRQSRRKRQKPQLLKKLKLRLLIP